MGLWHYSFRWWRPTLDLPPQTPERTNPADYYGAPGSLITYRSPARKTFLHDWRRNHNSRWFDVAGVGRAMREINSVGPVFYRESENHRER